MPEGHVTHRIAGMMNDNFAGRIIKSSSPQGRFAESSARIDGRAFDHTEAYGKHMLVAFEGLDERVNIHLGLLGKFFWTYGVEPVEAPITGAIRWRLGASSDDGDARGSVVMDLRGPNVCALKTPDEVAAIVGKLGPDPLRVDADPDVAWVRIRRTSTPIAALLMDQKVFNGVGNIYRAEVLFRHGIDPKMPGKFLRREEFDAIWADFVALMPLGVRDGRIDTVRPEHTPEAMGREPRVDKHGGEVYVYRRAGQPCLVCGTPVALEEFAGRNLFWCPSCQPRHRRRRANA